MRCPLGHDSPDHGTYCMHCGSALWAPCMQGHSCPATVKFCGECGAAVDPDKVAAPALQLSMSGSNSEPTASDAASLTTTVPSAFCDCGGTTIMARGTTIAEGTERCNNCGRPVSMDRVRSVVVPSPAPRPPVLPAKREWKPPPNTNVLAIVAIVSVFFVPVLGLIFGYVALNQISSSREQGRGLAIAAVLLGWIGVAIWGLALFGMLAGGIF